MSLAAVLLWSALAGVAIPIGALFAFAEHRDRAGLHPALHHAGSAFGSGVLLAALTILLVPVGWGSVTPLVGSVALLSGALAFLLLDRTATRAGDEMPELIALGGHFLATALALGAAFAGGGGQEKAAPMAAILALHHVPGGFNSFKELHEAGLADHHAVAGVSVMGLLGPAAALLGYHLLPAQGTLTGFAFLFAAGGILFLVFHELAPRAVRIESHPPSLGVVVGFLIGLLTEVALG